MDSRYSFVLLFIYIAIITSYHSKQKGEISLSTKARIAFLQKEKRRKEEEQKKED